MAYRDTQADSERKISDCLAYVRKHLSQGEIKVLIDELLKNLVSSDLSSQVTKKLESIRFDKELY